MGPKIGFNVERNLRTIGELVAQWVTFAAVDLYPDAAINAAAAAGLRHGRRSAVGERFECETSFISSAAQFPFIKFKLEVQLDVCAPVAGTRAVRIVTWAFREVAFDNEGIYCDLAQGVVVTKLASAVQIAICGIYS